MILREIILANPMRTSGADENNVLFRRYLSLDKGFLASGDKIPFKAIKAPTPVSMRDMPYSVFFANLR